MHDPLARELFNAAFIACWVEMDAEFREELVLSLKAALNAPNIPPDILQSLLNLCEFMERNHKPLPIPVKTLGGKSPKSWLFKPLQSLIVLAVNYNSNFLAIVKYLLNINNDDSLNPHHMLMHGAQLSANAKNTNNNLYIISAIAEKCAAWAQSAPLQGDRVPDGPSATCEALISINHQLDLPKLQRGSSTTHRNVYEIELKESWYEKLQRWETAYSIYLGKGKKEPENLEYVKGRMRCLHAMAEWEDLSEIAEELWGMKSAGNFFD
jgi:phosphatidylinositol kinase/protein kinase (PI-3  family)